MGRSAKLITGMEAVYPCRLVGDTAALSQRLLCLELSAAVEEVILLKYADIINHLGIGIVRFQDLPPQAEIEAPDVEYRVDTDVITSIMLQTGSRITPEEPVKVTFHIMGLDYTVQNIVIPEDD